MKVTHSEIHRARVCATNMFELLTSRYFSCHSTCQRPQLASEKVVNQCQNLWNRNKNLRYKFPFNAPGKSQERENEELQVVCISQSGEKFSFLTMPPLIHRSLSRQRIPPWAHPHPQPGGLHTVPAYSSYLFPVVRAPTNVYMCCERQSPVPAHALFLGAVVLLYLVCCTVKLGLERHNSVTSQ